MSRASASPSRRLNTCTNDVLPPARRKGRAEAAAAAWVAACCAFHHAEHAELCTAHKHGCRGAARHSPVAMHSSELAVMGSIMYWSASLPSSFLA